MKNKFYVFPQLTIFVFVFSVIGILIMTLCVTLFGVSDGQKMLVIIVLTATDCALLLINISYVCVMLAQITIDENGVTKYLFGKKIKFFSWERIREIKGLDNTAYWIVFCNKLVPDEKLIFNNRKSYTIPIHKRQEVVNAIKHYCPNKSMIDKL